MVKGFKEWISEKVEYHQELNPKVWQDNQMKPELRAKLLEIAKDFWTALKLEIPVEDIQLTGSIANYNWTSASDFDVHVIIDFSKIDPNVELVRKALDGQRFMWNQRHPVVIQGHDVELYAQDKNEQHVSSGLFSLLRNQWIVTPSYNPPQVDEKDVNEKIRVIKSELKEVRKKVKGAEGEEAKRLYDYLERIKKKIMADRKVGLATGGEFSVENLVFKELRRDGIIEDIIDLMSSLYSKQYSE
jgi:hypothetical protein